MHSSFFWAGPCVSVMLNRKLREALQKFAASSSLELSCSYLEVHSRAFLGVNSEAPCNVLPDAPDEALEMNVEFDEVEPSIELLEIS